MTVARVSLLLCALCAVVLPARAQDEPRAEAPVCPASCLAPRSALDDVAARTAAGLGRIPDGALIGIAPLESDEEAPKGDALADKIATLVAGRFGSGATGVGAIALDDLRARAVKEAPGYVMLSPKIAGGRLHVVADAYPIARSVWARARSVAPAGPIKHTATHAPIDAEVRSYLTPISFERQPKVAKYDGADKDMLALACGDLDGDGANDLVTMSRWRVLTVALAGGKLEHLKEARWKDLAPIAPAPMRQPMGFATIVEGRRYVDVAITDRAGSARLGPELTLLSRMEGMSVPHGQATACTWVSNLMLGDKMLACTKAEPAPAIGDLKYQSDIIASALVVDAAGKMRTVTALRREGSLVVRDTERSDRIIGRVGAQLAVGDIDQDGMPEVVTTVDTLARRFDALSVRTLRDGKLEKRFRLSVRSGVEAVALCPPDGQGQGAIVLASKGQVWVVR